MRPNSMQTAESLDLTGSGRPGIGHRDELLTVSELATKLKVPVSWVYERARRRSFDRIPHLRLGKYLRFSEQEVLAWLEKMKGI
jgi:excisionase family DNA binding protein